MEEKLKRLEEELSETSSEIAQTWNTAQEELLASIADRSLGMSWMHSKSQRWYDSCNFWLTIPSIIIGTLSGSATMGLSSWVDVENQKTAQIVVGLLTLSCGVLTSVNNFIKSSQRAEGHRSASLAYAKLHRMIQSEVALRRDQRVHAADFIKVIRTEQDRLEDTSPEVLDLVVHQFRKEFKHRTDLEKPEIAGDLDHVHVNRSMKAPSHTITPQTTPQELPSRRYSSQPALLSPLLSTRTFRVAPIVEVASTV